MGNLKTVYNVFQIHQTSPKSKFAFCITSPLPLTNQITSPFSVFPAPFFSLSKPREREIHQNHLRCSLLLFYIQSGSLLYFLFLLFILAYICSLMHVMYTYILYMYMSPRFLEDFKSFHSFFFIRFNSIFCWSSFFLWINCCGSRNGGSASVVLIILLLCFVAQVFRASRMLLFFGWLLRLLHLRLV